VRFNGLERQGRRSRARFVLIFLCPGSYILLHARAFHPLLNTVDQGADGLHSIEQKEMDYRRRVLKLCLVCSSRDTTFARLHHISLRSWLFPPLTAPFRQSDSQISPLLSVSISYWCRPFLAQSQISHPYQARSGTLFLGYLSSIPFQLY